MSGTLDASFARLQAIAAATGLPGIEPGTSYGTPALKVAGKFLCRLLNAETLVLRCAMEEKEFLLEANPALFFETPHYHGHPAILLRLAHADDATIAGRLRAGWEMQAPPGLRRRLAQNL